MSAATAALPKPRLRGWLHAAMVPLAVVAGLYLLLSTPSDTGRWSVGVFAFFLVGLYATSSIYHVPRWNARVRYVLSRCDLAMIQLFIAGTFTPIAHHALQGAWRTWSLVVAWSVAIVGAVIAASPVRAPRWLSTLGFVAIGWLGVVPFVQLMSALPWEGTSLIALGGVLYTVGAVVYARRWPDPLPHWFGFHEVFHLFVVAGSTAHYLAIWRYVLPLA
jgi:hemolysin III